MEIFYFSPNWSLILFTIFQILSKINSQDHHEVPCDGIYKPAGCERATVDNLDTVEDFMRCAPAKLPPLVRDYIWSGSGREITLRENYEAYKRIRIRKRGMRNLTKKSLKTKMLGKEYAFPVGISPTAGQSFAHAEGDIGTAKGAYAMGTLSTLSSYATTPLEKVAASVPSDATLWMQTYIFPNRSDVIHLMKRAENAGFKAIVVTVDESADTPLRCKVDSRFVENLSLARGLPNLGHPGDLTVDHTLTFADITWLKTYTKLPIIAKGIMNGEDALEAIKAGASAIMVSNHGGRQLDGAVATIDALPEIADMVKHFYPHVDIYVDGGISNGYDVFKAIARGATAAFIGRANIWGLTMGGEKGVKKVLSILKREFEEAMLHAGFNNPKEITKNSVIPQRPNFSNGFYAYEPRTHGVSVNKQ